MKVSDRSGAVQPVRPVVEAHVGARLLWTSAIELCAELYERGVYNAPVKVFAGVGLSCESR